MRKKRYTDRQQLYLFPKFIDDFDFYEDPVTLAQKQLNNFWERPKSLKEVGELYERYIGYAYEDARYTVDYFGIRHGKMDAGRDLVCRSGNHVFIVQCKNWAWYKTVFADVIYQLHGSVGHYRFQYPHRKVFGVCYSTTNFSISAISASKILGIEIHGNFKLPKRFPIIKCQASTRMYYLPDDWDDYDSVKLDLKVGDCYCATVSEAEQKGFVWAQQARALNNRKTWRLRNPLSVPLKNSVNSYVVNNIHKLIDRHADEYLHTT